ncbi:hypothetical protein SAY87_028482 [Trapa incisa]|uniref:GB1/RHD3-type G domain-containing protein n=1 Tax=Trapa incisa TaxID=236973 RepID=A0AAN7QRM0_9MYRT|nr:hypothetical protein SAY87_028482 [Trapa incisa]
MDANNIAQTTKGIWLARAADSSPITLVVDLEGTDGEEREDDIKFERQSALFAFVISDVLLQFTTNCKSGFRWCNEVGRLNAANKPLLKTVFQEMMQKVHTHSKRTLIFVLRDKTKSPEDQLQANIMKSVQKIWDSIRKPREHTTASTFRTQIGVVALSNYQREENEFKEQVLSLKRRIFDSITSGELAGDRNETVPGSAFSRSALKIWELIKQDKNLDLPALNIMVAKFRCKELAERTPILKRIRYQSEAMYFDERIASEHGTQLEGKLTELVAESGGKVLSLAARDCKPRVWTPTDDFHEISQAAFSKSLELFQ